MYIIYSQKANINTPFFENEITILDSCETISKAVELLDTISRAYLHAQTETGFQMKQISERVVLITRTSIVVNSGFIWNTTVLKNENIVSFHIAKMQKTELGKISSAVVQPQQVSKNNAHVHVQSSRQILINQLKEQIAKKMAEKNYETIC